MLLNKTATYALKSLQVLASVPTGERIKADDVATIAGTPKPYTTSLLTNMVKNGFLSSKRGRDGGTFCHDKSITLVQILETLQVVTWEEGLSLGQKFDAYYETAKKEFLAAMEKITLADLAEMATV